MKRLLIALVLTLSLSSCTVKAPTPSSDPYGFCVKSGADIASSITQGMNTVAQLQVSNTITKQEASNILDYLEFANVTDKSFLACAQGIHTGGASAGTYTSCAQTFLNQMNNPQELILIHVVNSASQQTVQSVVSTVSAGINLIMTSLGGV